MKRLHVRRTIAAATVKHRGKIRPCVVHLDTAAGMIHIRPLGCRKKKSYSIADLFTWGQQLHLPIS
jgi:hypothetical protein